MIGLNIGFIKVCVVIVVVIVVAFHDNKHTIFYWKYTAHHINQPLQKTPFIEDLGAVI